jgi:ankyrin repeat protein
LLEKKASPLKQDHAGGTVLHHAIEKGHIEVLEIMLAHGIDVYSAIEIADNAGRTPLFEAVENLDTIVYEDEGEEKSSDRTRLVKMLVNSRKAGGFGAKPNVINFNGQTPLFQAVREGCLETVKVLVEAGAKADLNSGELVKTEEGAEEDDEDEFDSLEEKYFMEAFKNCMTPL